jgi:predicted N-acetyltransferase YhbS
MKAAVTIRAEQPNDSAAIRSVVLRAYANVAYSDHCEHLMIDRLRATRAYSPALSLLAEKDGELIGHILLTRAHIVGERASVPTLALAPLSVVPEHQTKGVGKSLVEAAHRRASDLGFGSILVVGPPAYYLQFGYAPLSSYPITLPFDAPDQNCMILPLEPHALDGVSGVVQYAEGWLDH